MADKLHKKVLVVAVVSISVLVLGFLLLNFLGISIVGQAWSQGQPAPAGYYWEQGNEPEILNLPDWQYADPQQACAPNNFFRAYGTFFGGSTEGCCSGPGFCPTSVYSSSPDIADGLVGSSSICFKENSFKPIHSGDDTSMLCVPYKVETKGHDFESNNGWVKCDINGNLLLNDKFICEASQWYACDQNSEADTHINNKYFCNSQTWVECNVNTDNPFCQNLQWNFDVSLTDAFTKVSNVNEIELKGDTVDENNPQGAVDLALNKIFYNIINPQKTIFFKYDGTFYKIEFDQQFELSVSTIGNDVVASEILQNNNQPHFNPVQLDLDFDEDNNVDAYVNVIVGTPYGSQELLLVVSPSPDFDDQLFETSVVLLSSGDTKEFSFQGDYTFNMFENQGNYIMVIQNDQYVVTEGSTGTHYLDQLKTISLGYESEKAFDKFVVLEFDTTKEYTSLALSPQEKVNLTLEYEAQFDNNVILDIQDNNFGLVSICENDPPILHTLTVCNKTQEIFDLTDGEVHVEGDLLFLYHSPEQGGAKTGNAYKIIDLQQPQEQLAVIFANNLVDAKSVVLKAHNEYYLLSSGDGNYLDLTQLELKRLGEGNEADFLPDGNQEDIVFNLPLGEQINIQLEAVPNLRYILSSEVILKDNIDLVNELQTQFSTYSTITITTPNIGEVSLNEQEDIKLLQNTMKIEYGNEKVELIKGEPHVDEFNGVGVMFLYDTFTVDGISNNANTYAKYADVYLYSDLTGGSFVHEFNSQNFILPLVKGSSIAFSLEGKYYLLSYSEPWTGQQSQGFEISKMQLTSLDDQETFPLTPVGNEFEFDLGDNKIEVEVDTNANEVTFTGLTAAEVGQELTVFNSEDNFSATLTPGTEEAQVVLEVNGVEYRICDEGDIEFLKTQVFLCHEDNGNTISETLALNQEKIIGDDEVRYKYLGEINGEKTIIFQHIFTLDQQGLTLPWTESTDNLAAGRNPLLLKDNEYLELSGGKDLGQFMLEDEGESYGITLQSNVEAFENGTIPVKTEQIFFQKSLVGNKIWLDINLLENPIITEEGLEISSLSTFVAEIGGEVFTVEPSPLQGFSNLMLIQITNSNNVVEFSGFLPEGSVKTILLSDGNLVQLEVLDTGNNEILLSK